MSTTDFPNDPGAARASSQGGGGDAAGGAGAKDQARQAAGTAAGEGQRVAGVAQQEVGNVVSEARTQLSSLVDDATNQLGEQSRTQKDRLAETARTFADDLHHMRGEGDDSGVAAQVVQQVAQQAHSLATHLEDREPAELLEDVRRFARRRPGTFLLGALAAGIVVGRVTRGAKAASQDSGHDARSTPATVNAPTTTATSTTDVVAAPAAPLSGGTDDQLDLADAGLAPGGTGVGPKAVEVSEAGVPGTTGPTGGGRP